MSKGLSGIITALIILSVAIILVGGFSIWINSSTNTIKETAEETVQKEGTSSNANIAIINVEDTSSGSEVSLTNNGKISLDSSKFNVFVNGEPIDYSSSGNALDPSNSAILTIDSYNPIKCDFIRITGEFGTIDEIIYQDDGSCRRGVTDVGGPDVMASHSPTSPTVADDVTIMITASDSESTILSIEVYVDDNLVKTCSTSPCSSDPIKYSQGTHTYYGRATSQGGTTTTSTRTFNSASLCKGNVVLSISPTSGNPGITITSTASGVTDCDGKTIWFATDTSCSDRVSTRSCTSGSSGCSDTFPAPSSTTDYYACIDKNDDNDYSDSGERSTLKRFTAIPPCTGNIGLTLTPPSGFSGTSTTATASGLSNCNGKTVKFSKSSSCTSSIKTCTVSGSGCSSNLGSQTSTSNYYACIDKNDDSNYADSGEKSPKRTFTITQDNNPPQTTINSGPSGVTTSLNPTFSFSCSDAEGSTPCEFRHRILVEDWSQATSSNTGWSSWSSSNSKTFSLKRGGFIFEVQSRDSRGNIDTSQATRSFEIKRNDLKASPTISQGSQYCSGSKCKRFRIDASTNKVELRTIKHYHKIGLANFQHISNCDFSGAGQGWTTMWSWCEVDYNGISDQIQYYGVIDHSSLGSARSNVQTFNV